jgi:hypothetical protein
MLPNTGSYCQSDGPKIRHPTGLGPQCSPYSSKQRGPGGGQVTGYSQSVARLGIRGCTKWYKDQLTLAELAQGGPPQFHIAHALPNREITGESREDYRNAAPAF